MQQYIFILFAAVIVFNSPVKAQQLDQLTELQDHSVKVYYSTGQKARAVSIAIRVNKAMSYYKQLIAFEPEVTLLILNQGDWTKYTTLPVVYGMPHYNPGNKTLVVAAEDNPFWKSFIPPVDQLPKDIREQIQAAYESGDGALSMQPFFDLLALHELGHAFHIQAGLTMQRKWMGELFPNILLHTYIAENEPEALPALTLFPRMVVAGGSKEFTYTSLGDIEERYDEIGQKYPKNYGWYQCRWHSAAATIYDAAGKQVCRKLWDTLNNKKEVLADKELAAFLETAADKSIANMMRNWDRDTVR